MNPQQEAVALWRYIESRGQKPTFRVIASVLRSWGLRFTDGALVVWLTPYRATAAQHARNDSATPPQQKTSTNATTAQQERNDCATPPPLLRAHDNVSLVTNTGLTDDSLRSSSSAQPAGEKPIAQRLPLDAQVESAKHALLNAVWELLGPHMAAAKTKTTWKRENANVARELARLGRSADEVVAAWHGATERLGSPCRTMRIVQDEIARMDAGVTGDCGCGLGKFDCYRLHKPHNTTTDTLPTIADLESACSL